MLTEKKTPTRRWILLATTVMICLGLSACGPNGELGSPPPSGAIDIGGPPVTSLPPTPPGWSLKEVVPQSQQEAQDTLLGYLRRTVEALPPGVVYDTSRYTGSGHNIPCEDEYTGSGVPPVNFTTVCDLRLPEAQDIDNLIASVGDIWKEWGWYVFERDGFDKPNRFGYAPDGYRLQIVAA
jgi:hypothetical protein